MGNLELRSLRVSGIPFTAEQQQAIRTVDRSVVVSAAAGSGKTAVLAARCVHLVAEAPPPWRCDVDRLLVLTFTDAAAREMRQRIVAMLRERAGRQPEDEHVRRQWELVDAAHISTLHAFCLWMCRRWFNELGIDPQVPLLDEEEARVLRREVITELFDSLYDSERDPAAALTDAPVARSSRQSDDKTFRRGFARLVDDYGQGDDAAIARLVLSLHDYAGTLPDPGTWLQAARDAVGVHADRTLTAMAVVLDEELRWQIAHVERVARRLADLPAPVRTYRDLVDDYLVRLRTWNAQLTAALRNRESPDGDEALLLTGVWDAFDQVCAALGAHEFPRARSVRLAEQAPAALLEAKEEAQALARFVREDLFRRNLRDRFGGITVAAWRDGLRLVAPHTETILELVERFGETYERRKRQMDVLDFSDLERMALRLLRAEDDSEQPSEIARQLRARFVHVLVDEFQDINPIQHAIVQAVCREGEPGSAGNLFVVGDVKQSIYRFRLGEPDLFVRRWEAFRTAADPAGAVSLCRNFRSRPEVLASVNLVFRELMRPGAGTIAYDDLAELHHGRAGDAEHALQPVELHILERRMRDSADHRDDADDSETAGDGASENDETASDAALDDPVRWSVAEREAYLIGTRLRELIASSEIRPGGEPLSYRHCVVLLRAARVTAEQMVRMFHRLGIPAHTDAGASLFDAREVRDVLAALQVLDNPRQDIPLTAVLRSGVFGEVLDADELIALRGLHPHVAFHECVFAYARTGSNENLRERVRRLLARIDAFRYDVRCRPVTETLNDLYTRHGFLAHVCALPDGWQRHANLWKVHELAGRFGAFRRQGLHRFLQFLEDLREQERDLPAASPIGAAEDVLRVLTVHQSKGLEFPVVFVAGLGNPFNIRDRAGRMIFERRAHLGLRVVDPQHRVEYPSAAHRLVVEEVERRGREEEMRILYVAMTRAREKLVLVAATPYLDVRWPRWANAAAPRALDTWEVMNTASALDWMAPILLAGTGTPGSWGTRVAAPAGVEVAGYLAADQRSWRISAAPAPGSRAWKSASQLDPLPSDTELTPDDPEVQDTLKRVDFIYRELALTAVPSVVSASQHRAATEDDVVEEAPTDLRVGIARRTFRETTKRKGAASAETDADAARRRGVVMHRVLQRLDFQRARDPASLDAEIRRLATDGVITPDDEAGIDRHALAWWVQTPLAAAIRDAAAEYRREFPFMTREAPRWYDPTVGDPRDVEDFVLVRGVVDGILSQRHELEIVDFKTDRVPPEQLAARVQEYRLQMDAYARAVQRLWKKPVTCAWLVFLSLRQVVALRQDPARVEGA